MSAVFFCARVGSCLVGVFMMADADFLFWLASLDGRAEVDRAGLVEFSGTAGAGQLPLMHLGSGDYAVPRGVLFRPGASAVSSELVNRQFDQRQRMQGFNPSWSGGHGHSVPDAKRLHLDRWRQMELVIRSEKPCPRCRTIGSDLIGTPPGVRVRGRHQQFCGKCGYRLVGKEPIRIHDSQSLVNPHPSRFSSPVFRALFGGVVLWFVVWAVLIWLFS